MLNVGTNEHVSLCNSKNVSVKYRCRLFGSVRYAGFSVNECILKGSILKSKLPINAQQLDDNGNNFVDF